MHRFRSSAFPILLLLASCNESTAPNPGGLEAIDVRVRVEPTTVAPGATANVILTLRNTSARSVTISSCPIYYWVETHQTLIERALGDGQIVGGSKIIYCLAASLVYTPLTFAPFETKTLTFSWLVGSAQEVPQGVYDVFGWVNDPSHASRAVQITVLPAK